MASNRHFAWTEFYMEFADRLLEHRNDRSELLAKVREVCNGLGYSYLDNSGTAEEGTGLPDICPFTTMGTFNRGIKLTNRKRIATEIGNFLGVKESVPDSFDGIPILNNQNSVVFWDRHDIDSLWQIFEDAIGFADIENEFARESFVGSYDRALQSDGVGRDLTMGLFWIRPRQFVSLDNKSTQYIARNLGVALPNQMPPNGQEYLQLSDSLKKRFAAADSPVHSFQELSLSAYVPATESPDYGPIDGPATGAPSSAVWLIRAGARGQDENLNLENAVTSLGWQDVPDLTDASDLDAIRALVRQTYPDKSNQSIGNTAGQLASYRLNMQEGDVVVLPLKTRPGLVALGYIAGPYIYRRVEGDQRHTREVSWRRKGVPRSEFGEDLQRLLNLNRTVNHIQDGKAAMRIAAMLDKGHIPSTRPYSVPDIVSDGCFLEESSLNTILDRLKLKKNLILQGPPGTGKTWLAKKLAFALLRQKDDSRVSQFQFHPNLSYEDFIRGYRPDGEGKLTLVDGPFLKLVEEAKADTSNDYVMVIEEINRGNPAQILGEMLTLLEADKRNPDDALRLAHSRLDTERVYIPPNLYVIGTMNLADRSIALVDLALRRRFAFIDLAPSFGDAWRSWMLSQFDDVSSEFLEDVQGRLTALNDRIASDHSLGPQFCVGHSYVTPAPGVRVGEPVEWFKQIVHTEIGPLLDEYWFDRTSEEAKKAKEELLSGL